MHLGPTNGTVTRIRAEGLPRGTNNEHPQFFKWALAEQEGRGVTQGWVHTPLGPLTRYANQTRCLWHSSGPQFP